jgi:hypothetical protein
MGFGQRRKYRPSAEHTGDMDVRTTDTGHSWHVGTEDGRIHARRAPSAPDSARREPLAPEPARPADCTVTGPASGLYLFLWNRSDAPQAGVTITGNPAFLAAWQSSVRVRWG